MKKQILSFFCLQICLATALYSQDSVSIKDSEAQIYELIDTYAEARENRDTTLLREILTSDIDQLVSSGTWRLGIETAVKGMQGSSTRNPGKRTLTVERVRFLNNETGIADARYEIQRVDGSIRKMWSTFIVVYQENRWKITAIRNMLPAGSK